MVILSGLMIIGIGLMIIGLSYWDYYKQNFMWNESHTIGSIGGGIFIGAGLAMLYYGYF